jgi:Family of unknown function (DUF6339)
MRFDSQKGFPYPVLRPDIDDYQSGEFQTTVDLIRSQNDKKIRVKIHTALSIEEIRDEVAKGRAAVSIIIACRETYFRDAIVTNKFDIEKSFDSGMFRGEVEISPFIVATKPISKFRCRDINSEFASREFSFEIGEVLAALSELKPPKGAELFESENCAIFLAALKKLTPYEAADERLWTMLSHTAMLEHGRARWPIPTKDDDAVSHIETHFFCANSARTRKGQCRFPIMVDGSFVCSN